MTIVSRRIVNLNTERTRMNTVIRTLTCLGVGLLLIAIYFQSNIRGYLHFRDICRTDAGLKVYESISKNAAWQASGENALQTAGYLLTYYEYISSVSYQEPGEEWRELIRTTEKSDRSDSGFRTRPLSTNAQPLYGYRSEVKVVADHERLQAYGDVIVNIKSGRVAVRYQDFTYRLFAPDWGLGRGRACSSQKAADPKTNDRDAKEHAIQSAFSS